MSNFRWGLIAAIAALFISLCLGLLSGVNAAYIFIRALVFSAVFFGLGFGLHFLINSFFPELLYGNDEALPQDAFTDAAPSISITLDSTGEYAVPELYKTPGKAEEMGNIEDLISGYFKPRAEEIQESRPMGIDRKKEEGYNDFGSVDFGEEGNIDFDDVDSPGAEKTQAEKPAFNPSFGDAAGVGGLLDLDMMAKAFSGMGGGEGTMPPSVSASNFGGAPAPAPSVSKADESASVFPLEDMEEAVFEPDDLGDVPVLSSGNNRSVGNKPQQLEGDFDPKSLAEGIRTVLSKDK